jgi:dipeptidyl aminopeptidase/acylaminoacyl peptidase
MVRNEYDRSIIYKAKNDILMLAQGASPDGDMPYISRYNLKTGKNDVLWRCQAPYYEQIVDVADPVKLQLITSRQSTTEPVNYYLRDVKSKKIQALTAFPNPYPSLEGMAVQQMRYKRADGLDLTATLYTPPGYNKDKDGRLPVLMWAYPREYVSANDAAQVRGSKYTFPSINYGSPIYWVTRGFAVMNNTEMPIVGGQGVEPNDNFIQQLTMNAEAAAKAIYDLGIGDTTRLAVGGHSYGAFMTANLMTHTKLFKAGIARSGAYNRTLTPFGFQAETRTYWEAPQVYYNMSPFNYADNLSGALLLVHGMADNNSGTFPIQSERFFAALKGHGATTRLVMLPHESHGYAARESLLHLLFETDSWLMKYVKNK